ncbi:MAG: polymerase subunit epsilon [Frankiales bacterium]|nr:polymerase subunit epsilon [Frankiales bacterium]
MTCGTVWHEGPLLAFDTETTGVDPFEARIVQAALVLKRPGHAAVSHVLHMNPGVPIPPGASAVHGITDQQAASFPPAADVLPKVASVITRHLTDGTPLVVFNAAYDCTLLEAELDRHSLPTVSDRLGGFAPVIDPFVLHTRVSRIVSRKLEHLCRYWGVPHDGPHNAGHDAAATGRLATLLGQRHPQLNFTAEELHHAQIMWRQEFCEAKRGEYDGLGWKHDGWDGTWPIRQRTAVPA